MKLLRRIFALANAAIAFSFVGWLFEVLLFRIAYGGWFDRGFLTLPFCPIYGLTLLFVYIFMGTPTYGGLLLHRIGRGSTRAIIFFIISAVAATVVEFLVGGIMEAVSGRILWDYSGYTFSLGRYACVEVAVVWGVLISFGSLLFDYIVIKFSRLPIWLSGIISILGATSIATDFVINLVLI